MYSVDLEGLLVSCLLKLNSIIVDIFSRTRDQLESELFFEDYYLSSLLRRHCRNGAFTGFEYLLQKKILLKNDKRLSRLLTSRDKDGHTLLHCAAEGGSKDIFNAIINASKSLKITDLINVEDTTYSGETVLHLVCKNKRYEMCAFLLSDDNYENLLLKKKSKQGWNAIHFTAMSGSEQIFDLLESKYGDVYSVTKNGLNALDIACIHNHTEFCKRLIDEKGWTQQLQKTDAHGWNIAHFAAMVGNKDLFNLFEDFILKKTRRKKSVLHICCEYGHEDLCDEIIKTCRSILHDVDDEEWNALHYAAKGGNLKVYKLIEKSLPGCLCALTFDKKTVLHIACINSSVDICQYICRDEKDNTNPYKGIINNQTKFKDWTAAHYVAVEKDQDGTEERLIQILVKSGINLQAITTDGLTVLGIACEHGNKNLINYLINKHPELLDVQRQKLRKVADASNTTDIVFNTRSNE